MILNKERGIQHTINGTNVAQRVIANSKNTCTMQ